MTDFRDTLGVVTSEPHNSVISVVARLGLIGLVSWLWMQIELVRAGLRAYLECRRTGLRQSADLALLLIAFTYGILRIPSLVNSLFTGRSGESAIPPL